MSRRVFIKSALTGAAGSVLPESSTARPAATAPTALSLTEAAQLVRHRKISPVELTQACLDRIERLNPRLNAFITVTAESALASARIAESEVGRDGWKGALHGIPIALKDLLDTAGLRTTAGSALFKERIPQQDAEVVRRLKAASAVLLGKLNMHEFAFGASSAFSHFGPVRNPWNLAYSPGGSSGGSAAAVAGQLGSAAHNKHPLRQPDGRPSASAASYVSVMEPYVAILSAEAYEFHKEYVAKSPELYQAATLKRIRAGADVSLSTYMQSRRRLDQARHAAARCFADVDLLVTPTTPVPPFALSELGDPNTARPLELRMLHNTRPLNLLGLPTISVPCGFTAERLPIGLQISGPPGSEATVLRLARAYERATAWHQSVAVMNAG